MSESALIFPPDPAPNRSATPILDSGVLPPRRGGGMPRVLATGLLVAVILMESLAMAGGMWHENGPAVFLLLCFLAIAIHEIGHFVAGWAVGLKFSIIQIGPILVEKHYGMLRTHFSFDLMALGYTGMYANNVRRLRWRSLIYISGGPGSNLATAAVIILLSHLVRSSPTSEFGTATGQLAAISLVLAMASLIPLASTDGGQIEMLLCAPMLARRYLSTVALGSQFQQWVAPRHWKQTWIKAATFVSDKSAGDLPANWMAYLAANDRKIEGLAAGYLERCLEMTPLVSAWMRNLVTQEAVVFSAWFRMDAKLAEKWRGQLGKRPSLIPLLRVRIEVALCCARGDFDSAITAWNRGLDLIEQMPEKATGTLRESWLEWKTEIEQRRTQNGTAQPQIND